ncbi:MAG: carbohydrate kinase family protein, partial [Armatimonadota bacterium]
MPKQFDAVVAGYLGADLAPLFPREGGALPLAQLLRPGKLVEVGPLEISTGGVVANTGLAMGHFGCQTALMGLLGTDALGDLLLALLTDRGVSLHLKRIDAAGTAYGIVIAPPGTDRVFLECPGCNATFGADDLDYAVIAQSRLLHFGYPPLMPHLFADGGAELASLFTRVHGLGVATSLDLTLPDPQGPAGAVDWAALLARVLPHVDIFVPSIEELLY